MAVRNYLSGCEGKQHFGQALNAGAKHILMSYLYLRKQSGNMLRRRKRANPNVKFFIDSGAHTLQVSMDKEPYKNWTLSDFEQYVQGYVAWLKKNRKYIECAVELDIPSSINIAAHKDPDHEYGHGVVEYWRKTYFQPLAKLGIEIIYVWHGGGNGLENWEKMCAQYGYVGLPGELSSNSDFNKFITIARRYCTKIHGFAATKHSDFRDWPWYSIDSITWKTSEIYGTLIVWDEHAQKLKFEQDKTKRARYRQVMQSMGFNAAAIIADTDYKEVTRFALRSMTAMEDFYVRKYAHRTFYYELRLPHPDVIARWKDKKIWRTWKRLNPAKNFKEHESMSASGARVALRAIAAVQNRVVELIEDDKEINEFLLTYFRTMMDPQLVDIDLFQKEVASHIAPPNPPAIPRSEPSHYIPNSNRPKGRTGSEEELYAYTVEDLIHHPEEAPLILEEIEVTIP